jgi:F0F1-type ATP synthase assembly protein I
MTGKVYKHSAFVVLPLSVISLFFAEWRFGLSVIIGGTISAASFSTIVWAVRKFLGQYMAQMIIMGISTIKILLIFAVLIVLTLLNLIHVIGLVTGFTIVIAIIIIEGFIFARKEG